MHTKPLAIVVTGVLLGTMALHATASAKPGVKIRVKEALYTTDLVVQDESKSQHWISTKPLNNELQVLDQYEGADLKAQANPFSVSVYTTAHESGCLRCGLAHVDAMTLLTFRAPPNAGAAPLVFDYHDFDGRGSGSAYATIFDLTQNRALFHDDWSGPSHSLVEVSGLTFSPRDTYALELYAVAYSANDTTGISLSVTGLSIVSPNNLLTSPSSSEVAAAPVPEPASSLLLLAGLGVGLVEWVRRRPAAPRPVRA